MAFSPYGGSPNRYRHPHRVFVHSFAHSFTHPVLFTLNSQPSYIVENVLRMWMEPLCCTVYSLLKKFVKSANSTG